MQFETNDNPVQLRVAQTILDSITDAFFSLNGNWEFSYVNRQTEITLGREAAELLGKSIWDAYPGTLDSDFEKMYRKAAQERVALTFCSYYPDHDRWYDVNVYPAPSGLSVYFRDITARMQEETRRDALLRLTDIFRDLSTPEEITYKASEVLGQTLGVSRVGYGSIDPIAETLHMSLSCSLRPTGHRIAPRGGLGIGLALVKNLAELHGGTISCRSEGKDKGSQFTVLLPRHHVAQNTALSEREDLSKAVRSNRPLRVLVVDDNADAAQMLALYLETLGHQVLIEHSSQRAIACAKLEKPDVCVLDIGLPDMDGYELARQLRAGQETAHAFLIAVTGYGQEQDKLKAMAAGFDQHRVKPVDVIDLASLLDQQRS